MKRSLAAMLAVWLGTGGIQPASATLTDLANIPLAESSAESVPPNIYFILDDSGSMASDYMPDYVDDAKMCPDADNDGSRDDGCKVGDPPYSANAVNGVYYNPATRYRPPKGSDGIEWANASSTTPRNNPFFASDTSTKNLSAYQNTAWCKNSGDTPTGNPATDANCAYYPLNTDITDYPRYPDGTYKHRKTYNGPPVYYTLSGTVQWCTTSALTICQTKRTSSYTYPKFTGSAEVTGVQASRSFYVIQAGNTSGTKTINISFDGTTIASFTVNYAANNKTNRIDLAQKTRNAINGVAGWTATLLNSDTSVSETGTSGNDCKNGTEATRCARIQVTAPGSATSTTNTNYNKNFTAGEPTGIDYKSASANLSGGVNYSAASGGAVFRRVQINSGDTFTKYAGRSDCAGASCTYAEELQNFANWYAFYRTRMLMMKTGTSRAFASLDDNYRVGYSSISYTGMDDGTDASPNEFLNVRLYDSAQKNRWYTRLFAANPSSYTPLRAALSKAGSYYAGSLQTGGIDPITHSCQQNFTILSTDGYWNTNEESATYGPFKPDGTAVGDQDGPATVTAPSRDVLAKASTLADVAYYYYHTDLRTSGAMAENNVPRAGTNNNTDDVVTHQHMTTFTVGLGMDGTLRFVSDYKTNTSSSNDYYNILQGSAQWPDPIGNSGDERVDDLWHAAVNGRGTYFSARDPDSLVDGLQKALSSISQSLGSGAAAATSNLEPVAGDNFIYVGSYRTQMWDGDLAGHLINISTGTVNTTPSWQASPLLNARIGSTGDSDTRTIYSYDAGATNKLEAFTWANLNATQQGYFNNTLLTQYASWDAATQAAVTGEMLLNYIRGHNRNESQDRPGDYGTYYRAYRDRENVLGDLVHSQPVYVQKPPFDYGDTGYAAYKSDKTGRAGAVYVASNDGMLHAFNSQTGEELWAYVPPQVLPTLYKLADGDFANSHQYYVDASPVAGDVYIDGAWKTLLVGGFGKGARGYYALDVTDPAAPKALWNFTEDDLGYSFGSPVITKLEGSSQWVVILPSGYNNVSPGDGEGHLWVLDAGTGALVRKIDTNSGSTSSPSGLAHLSNWVQNGNVDNVTQHVYGGDLDGKVWKFDVVAGTTTLVANFGSSQPITAPIELGLLDANRVLFFGTGRYLGLTDTANTDVQSIYAMKDVLDNAANPRNNLVQQQLLAIDGSTRTTTENEVNWATKDGWYVDLPDSGERVNLQVVLQLGTLIAISNVPTATACSPGGYSWSYNFNPRSGTFVAAGSNVVAGTKYQNITVGFNVVKLPDGRVIIYRTGHKNPVPEPIDAQIVQGSAGGVRINWREIIE
jgi:type IV pilus assembly protein PilY1